MKNIKTLAACVLAASAAGIITEWSVAKDRVQTVAQSAQRCAPQLKSAPFELRSYYVRFKPRHTI